MFIKSIEKDTDYAFFYNNSDIDVSRVVSVSLKDASVEKVVSYILPGCVCRFDNKKIIIVKKTDPGSESVTAPKKADGPVEIAGVIKDSNGQVSVLKADYVILACGGVGGLFEHSTNFPHLTGDALAISLKHHVKLKDVNYIQIHPTTLYSKMSL